MRHAARVDQEVVFDGKLITSRQPAAIPAFGRTIRVLPEEAGMCLPGLGKTQGRDRHVAAGLPNTVVELSALPSVL